VSKQRGERATAVCCFAIGAGACFFTPWVLLVYVGMVLGIVLAPPGDLTIDITQPAVDLDSDDEEQQRSVGWSTSTGRGSR
jgi:hypothetical protein